MMSSEKQNSSLTSMCWIRETSGTDYIEPLMPKYAHIFWSASLTFSLGFHFSKKKKILCQLYDFMRFQTEGVSTLPGQDNSR